MAQHGAEPDFGQASEKENTLTPGPWGCPKSQKSELCEAEPYEILKSESQKVNKHLKS